MFLHADQIVKAVMIGLAVASLVTWTVWVAKSIELFGARAAVRRGLRVLTGSTTLAQAREKLSSGRGPVAQLMQAAANEIRLSANLRADGLKERIAWQSERIEMAAGRKISRGTGILATIGATAPFVGLFGTVWGIMDSFIGISKAHTTNLAVVAPGIAEALLATALGLVAAIPAVMIYNVLARSTSHYRALIGDASRSGHEPCEPRSRSRRSAFVSGCRVGKFLMSTPRHESEGNPLGRCNSENKSPTESLCLSDPGRERQAACATGRWVSLRRRRVDR